MVGAIHAAEGGRSGPIRCAKEMPRQMSQDTDTSNAAVRPPVAWLLALAAGVAADQLYPLRFVPASVQGAWVGGAIFAIAFALAIWAIVTIRKAGTQGVTHYLTSTIVSYV